MSLPPFMLAGNPPSAEPGQPAETVAAAVHDVYGAARPEFLPGVFDGMPAAIYHAIEAMSASGAKKMIQAPALFKLMRETGSTPTDAMQLGTAIHDGTLEPDTFSARVVAAPKFDRRSKAGREDAEAFDREHAGKVILAPDDYARALGAIAAVRRHPSAAKLLDGAQVETSAFWYDGRYKVPCKARFDARNHGLLIDLKSARDASPDGFARQAASLLYHVQAAHYCSASEHVFDESPQAFVFIVVETEPPFLVGCYAVPGNAILAGAHLMNIALSRYAEALATGIYPGYPETIEILNLPKWALRFEA